MWRQVYLLIGCLFSSVDLDVEQLLLCEFGPGLAFLIVFGGGVIEVRIDRNWIVVRSNLAKSWEDGVFQL